MHFKTPDPDAAERSEVVTMQLRELQHENHNLDMLTKKIQALNQWKLYRDRDHFNKQVVHLNHHCFACSLDEIPEQDERYEQKCLCLKI